MIEPEIFEDACKLMRGGADYQTVLVFLRERGLDKIDSIKILRKLLEKTTLEAKTLVDESHAWSDRYEFDQELRAVAREAIRRLASEKSETPKLEYYEGES